MCKSHENGNEAQYSFKYDNVKIIINFENIKIPKIFIKKYISRYMYVLTTQEVYIHIPKHNWVHIYRFAWKANDSRGIHVYLKVWQNKHTHEMKAHDHKINPKREYKFKNVGLSKTRLY